MPHRCYPSGPSVDGHQELPGDDSTFLFTSESVGEGHPDKMCDLISDAVLDAYLSVDPNAKVACESTAKTGMILLAGEITANGTIDYQQVVRDAIQQIGYDDASKGFDYKTCNVVVTIEQQSQHIASGVHKNRDEESIGAGDQGLMFGYATDETVECMPLTIMLAHKMNEKLAELRRSGTFWWARPDCKTQVTCEYKFCNGATVPQRVHTVVVSTQHSPKIPLEDLREQIIEQVVKTVIPKKFLDKDTVIHINPCGTFIEGGPMGDAGLTGRKIIVDTYGGWGAHGGGAFSGKDPTKVDRSAAYAARWVAKSIVKSGLARRCLVQLSYAIGIAEPIAISVFTYGTSCMTQKQLLEVVKKNFDLRPGKIIRDLRLKNPVYYKTAAYGHFGREIFPWEKPKTLIL